MAALKVQALHYHGIVEIDVGGAYVPQDVSRPDRYVPYMRGGKAVRWRKHTQVEDSVPSLKEARHGGLGKPVRCGGSQVRQGRGYLAPLCLTLRCRNWRGFPHEQVS